MYLCTCCVDILDRYVHVDIMLACAGGFDHTRSAARPSDLGLPQHYQGIPRKGPEDSGDEESPHTVPGPAGLLHGLQSAAVGRAESTPLAGLLPLFLFLLLQLAKYSYSSSFTMSCGPYLANKLCTFAKYMLEDEGIRQISKTM